MTEWMPFVEIIGKMKFPTADENDGLGTGEFDYTAALDLSRSIGKLTPFLTVGYRFMGDPPVIDLDDVVLASVGGMYSITDPVTAGLFLDFRQAASTFSDDLLDVTPYLGWKITEHWSTSVYVTAGILDGSPDVGVGTQLTYTYTH